MKNMTLKVYLSGEIHTKWREDIVNKCNQINLDIEFLSPVLNHELSDDIGVKILGKEEKKIGMTTRVLKLMLLEQELQLIKLI